MRKELLLIFILAVSMLITFSGCSNSDQKNELDSAISSTNATVEDAEKYLSLSSKDIEKIVIKRLYPENGGTNVQKTLTDTDDKQAVLDIGKKAKINAAPLNIPAKAGGILNVQIYLNGDIDPICISKYDENILTIGFNRYSAKADKWQNDMAAIYDKSAEPEMSCQY